jgi:hypothetical protein
MNHERDNSDESAKTSRSVDVGGHVGNLYFLDEGAMPYELRIDKDGRWFHEGVEIVRADIRNFFSQHLVRSDDGSYWVKIGNDMCPVTVEDAPFVVARVMKKPDRGLELLLNDGRAEPLEVGTLTISRSNVPYCRLSDGLEARFSRPAYYQLAAFIEYDETGDSYQLVLDDRITELKNIKNGVG